MTLFLKHYDFVSRTVRNVIVFISFNCIYFSVALICSKFFLLLSTKENILKNVGNQRVAGSH